MTDDRAGVPDTVHAADVLAIHDVLYAYADAVDGHDWALARSLFTDDATLDYTGSGGPAGSADEVLGWIEQMLTSLGPSQHALTNVRVRVDGDLAHSVAQLLNPLLLSQGTDETQALLVGGRYVDRLRRVDGAWRIEDRVQGVDWSSPLRATAAPGSTPRPSPGQVQP